MPFSRLPVSLTEKLLERTQRRRNDYAERFSSTSLARRLSRLSKFSYCLIALIVVWALSLVWNGFDIVAFDVKRSPTALFGASDSLPLTLILGVAIPD